LKQQNYTLKGIGCLPKRLGSNDGDFSRTNSPFFDKYPLIHLFLGKNVLVELEDCVFYGKLIRYELGSKTKHKPSLLIVESAAGKVIIRGNWIRIAEGIEE